MQRATTARDKAFLTFDSPTTFPTKYLRPVAVAPVAAQPIATQAVEPPSRDCRVGRGAGGAALAHDVACQGGGYRAS